MTSLYHPVTGKRQNIADGNLLLRFSLLNLGWIEGESLPVDDLGENTGSFEGWQAAILLDIKGIGPKSLAALRAALGAG